MSLHVARDIRRWPRGNGSGGRNAKTLGCLCRVDSFGLRSVPARYAGRNLPFRPGRMNTGQNQLALRKQMRLYPKLARHLGLARCVRATPSVGMQLTIVERLWKFHLQVLGSPSSFLQHVFGGVTVELAVGDLQKVNRNDGAANSRSSTGSKVEVAEGIPIKRRSVPEVRYYGLVHVQATE
ncbi:hypothetical protein Pan97_16510 [Bremerella volcania]|uniref:Uncharacterized protein n=1 Tax=Bremerella volcania TaxID=2527984 RepID=A0A518C5Z3_9BACT|nr:hypothetical protein Pan97_16510 [Bremerella volcania]